MKKLLLLFFLMTISLGQSQNKILNGTFAAGTANWTFGTPGAVLAGEAYYSTANAGGNTYDTELKQGTLSFTNAATYTLTFRARAAANRNISVNIQNTGIWTDQFRNNAVALTTTMTTYSYVFNATSTNVNAQLNFHMANMGTNTTSAVYIDDVSIMPGNVTATPCANGIQDVALGETGVDCGGSCGACLITPTFNAFTITNKLVGDPTFTATATPSNGSAGAITYTSNNTGAATVVPSTGLVTIVGAGSVTITATQAATGTHNAGSTSATFTVSFSPPATGAPTQPARNAWDVVSLYSGSYTATAGAGWQHGADVSLSGNNARFFNGFTLARLAFAPVNLTTAGMTTLHLSVYTQNQNQLWFELQGNRRVESSIALNGWVEFNIPLTVFTGLNLANISFFDLNNPTGAGLPVKVVYMDDVYFYRAATLAPPTIGAFTVPAKLVGDVPFLLTAPPSNSAGTFTYTSSDTTVATISGNTVTIVGAGTSTITATQAADGSYGSGTKTASLVVTFPLPSVAAPTPPARNTWDVVSLYSGAYTPTTGATWGAAGADVSLSGNNARFFNGFTVSRLSFGATSVSAMTTLHIDVYTLNQNQLWFELNGNRKVVSSIAQNGWVSFDIPLTDYVGLNLANVSFFDLNNPTGASAPVKVVYLDNIYFYRAATLAPPTLGAFTVPAKLTTDAAFSLTAPPSNSAGAFTYTSSNNAVATISGSTVTIVGAGISTITATQAANGIYGAGSTTGSLVVSYAPPATAAPTPTVLAANVKSIYSNAYTPTAGVNTFAFGNGSATYPLIAGNNTIQYSGMQFAGNSFTPINLSTYFSAHLDVWSPNVSYMKFYLIGVAGGESGVQFPVTPNSWNSIDILLSSYSGTILNLVKEIKYTNVTSSGTEISGGVVYLDNVYFSNQVITINPSIGALTVPGQLIGNAPFTLTNPTSNSAGAFTYTSSNTAVATVSGNTVTVVGEGTTTITASQAANGNYNAGSITASLLVSGAAPTPPARNAWDVVSLYSGAYTATPGATWQNGSDISISGNTTRLFNGFTLARLAFATTSVSAMTTLHIDVYSTNQNPLWFEVNGVRKISTTPINGWVSLNIPLTDFAGLNLANISFFDLNNPTGASAPVKVVYLDNIYFYRAATLPPPTLGVFTVPAKLNTSPAFVLTKPTSNSTGAFTYTSSNTSVATISGSTVTILGVGTSTITATQAAAGSYASLSVTAPLVVTYAPPAVAATNPTLSSDKVMSIFSNTYPVTSGVGANSFIPNWGQNALSQNVTIAGNTTKKYPAMNYHGVQFDTPLNITNMKSIHLDIYSSNCTSLDFYLINQTIREVKKTIALPIQAGWNSINIPISDFLAANAALDLTNIGQFKFENTTGTRGSADIYIDNMYFWNDQLTALMNGYRGATLSNLHAVFFASSVPGATTYRFEITKVSDGTKTVINSSVRSLILSQLLASDPTGLVTYATEYSIRVAVNNGGYAYGPAYSVFTPAKKTIMLGCGATLDKLQSVIAADLTPYATEYSFKVTKVGGGTTTIVQPGRIFYLTSLPDNELSGGAGLVQYNTSYSISAQARIDGDWTPESPSCTYTTPSPVTYMMQCGSTLAKLNSIIYADVAGQAAEYRFEVSGPGGTRTIDVPGAVRSFNLTQVSPAGVLGQTYSVRVAIRLTTGGSFQAYSATCTYTTPLARMSAEELSSEIFNVKAFPNPFASHFSLDIESSSDDIVEMKVYDMIGRQLEVRKASVSELSVQEVGHNYPSGVYNVIVSQGDKVKSVRMVKR